MSTTRSLTGKGRLKVSSLQLTSCRLDWDWLLVRQTSESWHLAPSPPQGRWALPNATPLNAGNPFGFAVPYGGKPACRAVSPRTRVAPLRSAWAFWALLFGTFMVVQDTSLLRPQRRLVVRHRSRHIWKKHIFLDWLKSLLYKGLKMWEREGYCFRVIRSRGTALCTPSR